MGAGASDLAMPGSALQSSLTGAGIMAGAKGAVICKALGTVSGGQLRHVSNPYSVHHGHSTVHSGLIKVTQRKGVDCGSRHKGKRTFPESC